MTNCDNKKESDAQIAAVNNILNEVINGLPLTPELQEFLEYEKDLRAFYGRWRAKPSLEFTEDERRILEHAFEIVLTEIGERDFPTRIGASSNEIRKLLALRSS